MRDAIENGRGRPAESSNPDLRTIVACVLRKISQDNVSILAAAVAFYALLCLFPALTAVVSLYGLFTDPTMVERQVAAMAGILPAEAIKLVATWLQALLEGPPSRFGIGLAVSVVLALWSAWSATGTLMTAVNICYGEAEKRGLIWFNIEALILSAGLAVFAVVAVGLIAVLPAVLELLPVPGGLHDGITLVRWPLLAGLTILALDIVYRYAPARTRPRWQFASWGAVIATLLWIAGSIAFTGYVSTIGSYDKTYGSLGAVIVLTLWFYLRAYVTLIGAEVNAELESPAARDAVDTLGT
jgi:membrane protein